MLQKTTHSSLLYILDHLWSVISCTLLIDQIQETEDNNDQEDNLLESHSPATREPSRDDSKQSYHAS